MTKQLIIYIATCNYFTKGSSWKWSNALDQCLQVLWVLNGMTLSFTWDRKFVQFWSVTCWLSPLVYLIFFFFNWRWNYFLRSLIWEENTSNKSCLCSLYQVIADFLNPESFANWTQIILTGSLLLDYDGISLHITSLSVQSSHILQFYIIPPLMLWIL